MTEQATQPTTPNLRGVHARPWHKQHSGRPPLLIGSLEQVASAYSILVQPDYVSLPLTSPPFNAHGADGVYTELDAVRDLLSLMLYTQALEERLVGQSSNESVTLEWLCKSQREAGEWRARYQAKHLDYLAARGPVPVVPDAAAPAAAPDACCAAQQLELPFVDSPLAAPAGEPELP